jgi:ABC-type branched-subunit amino acid transport system ATPase component
VQKNNANYILEVQEVVMAFGGLMALINLNLNVEKETIKAVVGPNGAGKTTLFNIITGTFPLTEGSVRFKGQAIEHLKAHKIADLGISRTFQTVELFDNMTVLENVMLGCHTRTRSSFIASGFRMPNVRREEKEIQRRAMEILEFIGLKDKSTGFADSLPLGDRKILEIGRALATQPELVCLDEPAAGLNETETETACTLIKAIKDRGITVLLVEHDMKVVMNISDEIMVLNYGEKIAEGVEAISTFYNSIAALKSVSLNVTQGMAVSIIGANGAGKSTLLKSISGLIKTQSGSIVYKDQNIAGLPAHEIVTLGISQVPEGRQLFAHLTVMDNIYLGAYHYYKRGNRPEVEKRIKDIFELFPILEKRSGQIAGTLSGGEQQMLAVARALMGRPELLLLDEPSMGLAPLIVREIFSVIKRLNQAGTTVLLVEQNAKAALNIAHHAYVLETGEIVIEGLAKDLLDNPKVKEAYLGG